MSIFVSDSINCSILGILTEPDRDERRIEKLSLRKKLKQKCQEQHTASPVYGRAETDYQLGKDCHCS